MYELIPKNRHILNGKLHEATNNLKNEISYSEIVGDVEDNLEIISRVQ